MKKDHLCFHLVPVSLLLAETRVAGRSAVRGAGLKPHGVLPTGPRAPLRSLVGTVFGTEVPVTLAVQVTGRC